MVVLAAALHSSGTGYEDIRIRYNSKHSIGCLINFIAHFIAHFVMILAFLTLILIFEPLQLSILVLVHYF